MTQITVGQALLLCLEQYKKAPVQSDITVRVAELKKLYMLGLRTPADMAAFQRYMQEPCLTNYRITYDIKAINNDASRRYFETHLALETMVQGLKQLDAKELTHYFQQLLKDMDPSFLDMLIIEARSDPLAKEYLDALERANQKDYEPYKELSTDDRRKLDLIIKCTLLGVLRAQNPTFKQKMGLDIYQKELHFIDRGKTDVRAEQGQVSSHAQGILKSYTPLPSTDKAYTSRFFGFLRPADQSRPHLGSSWVEKNFSSFIHPFSNSISGTLLCHLKNLVTFAEEHRNAFDTPEKLSIYLNMPDKIASALQAAHEAMPSNPEPEDLIKNLNFDILFSKATAEYQLKILLAIEQSFNVSTKTKVINLLQKHPGTALDQSDHKFIENSCAVILLASVDNNTPALAFSHAQLFLQKIKAFTKQHDRLTQNAELSALVNILENIIQTTATQSPQQFIQHNEYNPKAVLEAIMQHPNEIEIKLLSLYKEITNDSSLTASIITKLLEIPSVKEHYQKFIESSGLESAISTSDAKQPEQEAGSILSSIFRSFRGK